MRSPFDKIHKLDGQYLYWKAVTHNILLLAPLYALVEYARVLEIIHENRMRAG